MSLPSAVRRERTAALAEGQREPEQPDTALSGPPEGTGAGGSSGAALVSAAADFPLPRTRLRRAVRTAIRRAEGRLLVDTRAQLLALSQRLDGLEARVAELERGSSRDRTIATRVAVLEADADDRRVEEQRLIEEVAALRAALPGSPEPPAEGTAR